MFKKYFGDMGFWRIALKLAFPVAMQNLLTSSFILVDTIMVGQVGDVSLSAVGMAGQFGWFLNMITFGVASGSRSVRCYSQYWGAKDTAGIRRTYGIAVVSVCLISALFFVIGLLFPEGVVRIFNREPDVVEAGAAYLRIACWVLPRHRRKYGILHSAALYRERKTAHVCVSRHHSPQRIHGLWPHIRRVRYA